MLTASGERIADRMESATPARGRSERALAEIALPSSSIMGRLDTMRTAQ